MIKRTKAAITISATVVAIAAGLAIASPASANPYPCGEFGSDPRALCANVIKVNPGSTLSVRAGPGTDYAIVGRLGNGQQVEVECWGYGTPVNGYNIWTQLYSAGGPRWVSDYYLSTGHVQSFLPQC